MIKSLFLLVLPVIIFGYACKTSSQDTKSSGKANKPNIVIIFTDDQGYQDLGCFGSPDIKTPNIDAMAREGLRLTQFYVSQGVCSASRSSLMTGCYANRIGIHGAYSPYVKRGLNPDEITIAEVVKPLGYATAIYGKWHLGSEPELLPTRQGFDEYFGIPYSNDMWPHHPWQGQSVNFPELPLVENETVIDTLDDQSLITTWYTERAVSFIRRNKDKPFFLYVPHSMPHVPLFVSDKFKGQSERGLYGDVIAEIDWSVGEILKTLKEEGLDDNTLVIFTSDNGPWLSYGGHSGEALPLREGKGTALEGGVRVPCVMRWPGQILAGSETSLPAMTIDLLPTICEITGAPLPDRLIDGKSMAALMFGKETYQPHHEAYYFYYHQNELQGILSGDGRWKLYFPHKYRSLNGRVGTDDGLPIPYEQNEMGLELYDLHNDISEITDVSDRYPEIVESLQLLAEKARASMGDALTGSVGNETRPVGQL
jgi:arylsulfatase A-like enzyme